MTLTAESALLYGSLSNGPSGTKKKTSTHTRGDSFLLPNAFGHPCACVHSCGAAALRKIYAVSNCFGMELSYMPSSLPCCEHKYDDKATPASDLCNATLTSGQQSKHTTTLVPSSLTSSNSSSGAPTPGVARRDLYLHGPLWASNTE